MKDKELIKQEIEKQIDYAEDDTRYTESYREGLIAAYQTIKAFIDSLPEEHNEDLEEYYTKEFLPKEWFAKPGHKTISQFNFFTAQHFAKWQKQQIMKDAVDAFVNTYENTDDSNYVEFVTEQSPYKFKETEKCKLIIIKEE